MLVIFALCLFGIQAYPVYAAGNAPATDMLVQCDSNVTAMNNTAISGVFLPIKPDKTGNFYAESFDVAILSGNTLVTEQDGFTSTQLKISLGAVTNYDYDSTNPVVYEIKYRGHYGVVGEGNQNITEAWQSSGLYFEVVSSPVLVTSITVTGAGNATTVQNGSTLQMREAVSPANATNPNVTWSVSPGTGTVTIDSSSGLLKGTGDGTVTVKATANDGSGVSGTLQVTVTPAVRAPVLTTLILSGSIPDLTVGQAVYNLNNLSLSGTDQYGDPFSVNGLSIQWNLVTGSSYANLTGSTLTPVAAGSGTVAATVYGVTSNELGFTVHAAQDAINMYNVSIGSLTGGSITASPTSATSGTAISLTITPDARMQLKAGTLKYNDGTTDYPISGMSFTMPAANVIVTGVFELIPSAPTLSTLTLSGNIPSLTVSQAVYNLNNLSLSGTDQNGDPFNLSGQTVQWNLATGSSYASLTSSTLTPLAAGSGTVTASVYGVTSNDLEFTVLTAPSSAPVLQSAATDNSGTQILLTFSKEMADSGSFAAAFSVSVKRNNQPLSESVTQTELGSNSMQLIITLEQPLLAGDTVSISYTPGTLASADGGILGGFVSQTVTNQAPQPLLISAGNTAVTVSAGQTNLAITPETVTSAGNTPVSITVPSGVNDTTLNVAGLLRAPSSGTVTSSALPALNISAAVELNSAGSTPASVQVQIPQGTTVSAPAGWNGTINVPTIQATNSVTVTPTSGNTATVDSVIEVGYGNVPLTFNHAVRLIIPGQAGKKVGYVRNGTFYPINTVLSADDQSIADSTLAAGQDGYLNVGADLVIWTKHLTQFVTYTETPVNHGGGNSNAGGGGSYTPPSTSTTVSGSIINGVTGAKVGDLTATITTDVDGKDTLSINTAQLGMLKQPDGSAIPISDSSKLAITGAAGTPVTISLDGTIQIADLAQGTDNNFKITYDLGNSQKMTIGTMEIKIDSKGDIALTATLTGVTRVAGLTRDDTALEIAKASYPGKIANVVLVTADNYPDALAGSVLAYKVNGPILLVGSREGDQVKVLDYLKSNLDPSGTVYLLGGAAAVSSAMESQVAASGFTHMTRIAGADRYETSAKIADQLGVTTGTPLMLVSGENYPDALSISSVADRMKLPILLVQKEGFSDSVSREFAAIKPSKVYIIGGDGVISPAVAKQVAQLTGLAQMNIVRIGGADRYATSLAVAQYFNLAGQSVCVATGGNFPDALVGSVYAAYHNAPIILADGSLSDQVMNYLKTRKITGAAIFGGEAVVGKDVDQQLAQLMGQ